MAATAPLRVLGLAVLILARAAPARAVGGAPSMSIALSNEIGAIPGGVFSGFQPPFGGELSLDLDLHIQVPLPAAALVSANFVLGGRVGLSFWSDDPEKWVGGAVLGIRAQVLRRAPDDGSGLLLRLTWEPSLSAFDNSKLALLSFALRIGRANARTALGSIDPAFEVRWTTAPNATSVFNSMVMLGVCFEWVPP